MQPDDTQPPCAPAAANTTIAPVTHRVPTLNLTEPPELSCLGIAHYLRDPLLTGDQFRLLVIDYAARRLSLGTEVRGEMDEEFFEGVLPGHGRPRSLSEIVAAASSSKPVDEQDNVREDDLVHGKGHRTRSTSRRRRSTTDRAASGPARRESVSTTVAPPASSVGTRCSTGERDAVDIVVLTVTPIELRAARDVFRASEKYHPIGKRRIYPATITSSHSRERMSVAVTSSNGPHNVTAARAVDEIVQYCNPKVIFLTGIAAGDKSRVKLGDVVIPHRVHFYDSVRREEAEDRPRHEHARVPEDILGNLHYYDPHACGFDKEAQTFFGRLAKTDRPPRFKPTFSPRIVTGNAVIASGASLLADGRFLPALRDRHDQRLVAADQESWGFAEASQGRWWAIFRGISDYGDPDKHDGWQYVAASAAALCLRNFLAKEYVPPHEREL